MTSTLRAWWEAPAATPPPPRRVWRDWVLVSLAPVLAVVEAATRTDVPWRWAWALVLAGLAPTLLWRRVRPFTMLAIAFAAGTAMSVVVGAESEFITTAYFLVLAYAVMRWGSGRAMFGGAALMTVGILVSIPFGETTAGSLVGAVAVVATTLALGVVFRLRATGRARELDRVRLLEREQLARDLHDTVAHHVSAIAIQAQAGTALAEQRPDAAAEALRRIEGEASKTLDELRAMVRVLRADEAALAPVPGLEELRALDVAGEVPRVSVVVEDGASALPSATGAALFRIAQEAVTNARRHARGATRVDVRVGVDADRVHLEVRDDGRDDGRGEWRGDVPPRGPDALPGDGPAGARVAGAAPRGYGLAGMRERAALLGGVCRAGPSPDGGWIVAAELPRAGW
ncbi:sensor histidine kinase [Agromyces sp. LHK192]|uniref:sensor histidine kinase n=1 Tax=Agromyces sp. LHK192 TaxID=2498704 RepID=UPI000FDCD250|nr:histidine kinase [Agromyces sp. LHK192]